MFPPLLKNAVRLWFLCGCAVLLLKPIQVSTSSESPKVEINSIRSPFLQRTQVEGESQANTNWPSLEYYNQEKTQNVTVLMQKINSDIATATNKEFVEFDKWFEREKFKDAYSVEQISSSMQLMLLEIQSLLQNLPESPSRFTNAVKSVLQRLGFRIDKQFEVFLTKLENEFQFLDQAQGSSVERDVKQWSEPIWNLKEKLEIYQNWYIFCGQLKALVSSFEFQLLGPKLLHRRNKIVFIETDKVHWTRPDLLPIGSTGNNWLQFLEQNKVSVVGDHIKEAGSNLGSQHVKRLADIVRWALAPIKVSCANNGKLLKVTGTFVRLGEFLNRYGNLKGSCSGATEIQVYAGNTVFIDTDLYGIGKELNVAIIAPKWEVVGNRHVNLNGAWGDSAYPNKAENGNGLSADGKNGKPGGPGGPGGNFVGVAETILEAGNLTISVTGGNGGRGQDGGDGTTGLNGKTREFRDWNFYLILTNSDQGIEGQTGGRGGNGGNGGAAGYGGKPGNIYIKSRDASKVNIEKREGRKGMEGVGGKGGKGGNGGVNYICSKVYLAMIPINSDCKNFISASGSDGKNGVNGVVKEGLKHPKYPNSATDLKVVTSEFRKIFEGNSSKETKAFMNFLS